MVRHMMIARTRGSFREFSGTVHVADVPEESTVEAVIKTASIDTGDETRDAHLRSPEFLDVERYPIIVFRSISVRPAEEDRWEVAGELTVKEISRPVTLSVEFNGVAVDPWGNLRAAFLGWSQLDREEFGVTWNQILEGGGVVVGRGVRVELDIEAVKQD
jgi:polyisoprenoid-binding protein YceI